LLALAYICLLLLEFTFAYLCLNLLAFACICLLLLHLLAFAYIWFETARPALINFQIEGLLTLGGPCLN
jgi:hypothetical protein